MLGLTCDVASASDVDALWTSLQKNGIFVDVLILNAGMPSPPEPILERKLEDIWDLF